MKIHEYAFLDRDFIKFEDAKISIMTHAFLYGTAVFEGIRAYWNPEHKTLYALLVRAHLERIVRSCKVMRIEPYYSVDEMEQIVLKLIEMNKATCDIYIRPSWFKSALRIGPSLIATNKDANEDSFVVSSLDLGDYVSTDKGLSVMVSNWRRISDNAIPARSKINGSYVNTALSKSTASLAGFDDAIFLTEEGKVSEGSAMNLFIIRNQELITSATTENILEGITRSLVMQIAEEDLGLKVISRPIDRSELYLADEAFFVGTGAQVAPITQIDHYDIGNGKIGPISRQLQQHYFDICHGNNPKYLNILSPIRID